MNGLGLRETIWTALLAALVLIAICPPPSAQAATDGGEDSVIVDQNLFRDDRKPPPPPEFKVTVKRPVQGLSKVEYDGVVALGAMKKALVKAPNVFLDPDSKGRGYDTVWVKEGEKLGDYTVVSIDSEKLVMENDGKTHTVKLRPEGGRKGSRSGLLVLTDLENRVRKPGSLLLLYNRDGMLMGDATLADMGAPDLDPETPQPFGGRTDLITEEMLAENDQTTDTEEEFSSGSSEDDLERASDTVWMESGWTTVASLDESSAVEALVSSAKTEETTTESAATFTPGTTSVNIVISEPKNDQPPTPDNNDNDDNDDDKECAVNFRDCACMDVNCSPAVPDSDWDSYCCGERDKEVLPDFVPKKDETTTVADGSKPGFVP